MPLQALELKVPPPLVALAVALAMWFASRVIVPVSVPPLLRVAVAAAFGVSGVAVAAAGAIAFGRAKTTRNPLHPELSSALVRSGPYRFTRNPMYLGLLLLLLAWAAYLSSALALLGPFVFAGYIGRFQIRPEERALGTLFGSEYAKYKNEVRRWL
jgi:protein-S-isoprenylcysteine O-methyltransferase Ste14